MAVTSPLAVPRHRTSANIAARRQAFSPQCARDALQIGQLLSLTLVRMCNSVTQLTVVATASDVADRMIERGPSDRSDDRGCPTKRFANGLDICAMKRGRARDCSITRIHIGSEIRFGIVKKLLH